MNIESQPERDRLRIETIVAGGDGIARHTDGFVVFVPRTAPGEVVDATYTEQHRQWRRAVVDEVVEPGPDRRDPPCPHYERCGGCQLQHLGDDAQRAARVNIIRDAMRRIGKLDLDQIEIESDGRELGYRNRVSFLLRRDGDAVGAGYHDVSDPDAIVDVDGCPLAEPAINRVWAALRSSWGDGAVMLPKGPELRLTLRATADGTVGLAVEGGRKCSSLAALVERVDGLAAVWSELRDGSLENAGEPVLTERMRSHDVALAGTAFLQVNRDMAQRLDAYVREQCGDVQGLSVLDAYCGFGVRTVELALSEAAVTGIDADRYAISTAGNLAREASVAPRLLADTVERALPKFLPADLVILNPPRHGVDKRALRALVDKPPQRIVYVSCDPATLARDLRVLGEQFDLTTCRAFDLFPQTAHVETVVTLQRRD